MQHIPLLALACAILAAGEPATAWTNVGWSGNGNLAIPAFSPIDSNRMMIACDMGNGFLTSDGGRTWTMVRHTQLHASITCRPAFHPTDAKTIIAADVKLGLRRTTDGGLNWSALATLPGPGVVVGEIRIDAGNPSLMFTGTATTDAAGTVWRSTDGGTTWTACAGPGGRLINAFIDQTSAKAQRNCWVGTTTGVWRSYDGGATWAAATAGLPATTLTGFTGGANTADGTWLYCTIPGTDAGGTYAGGIYRSVNGGTWQRVPGAGLTFDLARLQWGMVDITQYYQPLTTDAVPKSVWVFNQGAGIIPPHSSGAYRSTDGGATWTLGFQPDPRPQFQPACNVERDYDVARTGQYTPLLHQVPTYPPGTQTVGISNDGRVAMSDWYGRFYITKDHGAWWYTGHCRAKAGTPTPTPTDADWAGNGLGITSAWEYYIDPFADSSGARRHHIAYTDLTFTTSRDNGSSWRMPASPPYGNCYQVAFDPAVPGRSWGAFSEVHDIPNYNIMLNAHPSTGGGGVFRSDDFCGTWTAQRNDGSATGTPKQPCTTIVLDPASPVAARRLYAGFFDHGVWTSTDGGASWSPMSNGLGTSPRVYRLALVKGQLFCEVTGKKTTAGWRTDGVGIYRYDTAAGAWVSVTSSFFNGTTRPRLTWLRNMAVDPANPSIIYVGVSDWIDWSAQGNNGLWRTADGGTTWTRVSTLAGCWSVSFHPGKTGWVYLSCSEGDYNQPGLWLSTDNGLHFTSAATGMAFPYCTRVTVDPQDPETIYVGTFGGSVFRGPADLNTPPTLSTLINRSIGQNGTTGAIPLAIGDIETAAAALTLTATSSDTALVPAAGLVFGGSGASRTLTATPAANRSGSAVITVRVQDGGGRVTQRSFTLTVTTTWTGRDIGTVGVPGSQTVAGGTITVQACGTRIGGTADSCRFVSQQLNGDGSITALVQSFTGAANSYAPAGLVIRESLAAGAREAGCLISQGQGVRFVRRQAADGPVGRTLGSTALPPRWLKLERVGDVITGWERAAATDAWVKVGETTLPGLPAQVEIGLGVASQSVTRVATAVFQQVVVIQAGQAGG